MPAAIAEAPSRPLTRTLAFESPVGWLACTTSEAGLQAIDWVSQPEHHADLKPVTPLQQKLTAGLTRYFNGQPETFSAIPLDIQQGTPFQRQVWQVLQQIPYGETRTYRWLAEQVGNVNASRAVGQANRRNPLPIIIPCHRVINTSGTLGGYQGASGLDRKQALLALEGPITTR